MTKSKSDQNYAKLVRGVQYVYRPKGSARGSPARIFDRGKWVPVSEQEREHLILNAVDYVTVSGGGEERPVTEERQKFQFRQGAPEDEENGDADTPLPRRRVR